MRQYTHILYLLSALAVYPSVALSAALYVSSTGNENNPGTLDQPFLTIAKAMSLSSTVFKPGDTVYASGQFLIFRAWSLAARIVASTSKVVTGMSGVSKSWGRATTG